MKILVTGPGAIGCLYACLLSEAGNDVQLLDNQPERAAQLNKTGIRLKEKKTRTIPIDVITDASEAVEPDYICICVKSFDTESAIRLALPAISKDTHIVSIQNGIGNAEIISRYSDSSNIICAATSQGATTLKPGYIKHSGKGPTSIAAYTLESDKAAYHFETLLNEAGIECMYRENMEAMLWSKLIVNAAINPVTATADLTNGDILKSDELTEIMRNVAKEAELVARMKNIELYYNDAADEAANICRATSKNISSMLQDVRANRKTEIDAITGAIIQAAKELHIDVPTNEVLYERVKKIECA